MNKCTNSLEFGNKSVTSVSGCGSTLIEYKEKLLRKPRIEELLMKAVLTLNEKTRNVAETKHGSVS